jgi:uncharacterized protein YjbI with pentapeptide repeats
MRWLKRSLLQVGIILTGMIFFLVLATRAPLSMAHAQEVISGAVTPSVIMVQTMPTEDATVTALNKEKLAQEVLQLKNQNEPNFFGWLQANAALLSTLLVVIGGFIGLWRWLADRRDERHKRAEERFQAVVAGLGDEKEGAKVGAAILLRTFLRPGYEQFYMQTFDLAVAHLRLPRIARQSDDPDGLPHRAEDPDDPLSLTTLSQALIMIFKESFHRARDYEKIGTEFLDATGIQLDDAYLNKADLKQIWMPKASLRHAQLSNANLSETNLSLADLSEARLEWANLSKANLTAACFRRAQLDMADLSEADLTHANLNGADLIGAVLYNTVFFGARLMYVNFSSTDLRRASFTGANLSSADLRAADLSGTHFSNANLNKANLSGANLTETNLEKTLSLKNTDLRGAKGLTKEQLAACKAKGAIIDEDSTTSVSQSTVVPSSSPQSNDTQAPSAPPTQESRLTLDPDGSNTASSQQEP